MRPNSTQKLLHNKGNQKQNKAKKVGFFCKNTCKQCDWQGINLQNLQTAHIAKYLENKQPNQKMSRRPT